MDNYQIFISYRRDGGDDLAGRLADRFNALGYKVFYDVESMRSGTFNTQILDAVAQCNDVLLVLPPNALDRCVNEDDWVRQELAFSLKQNKNIIPIIMRGFEFPKTLPSDIDNVRNMEGVTASSEYFDAVIQRIESLLVSKVVKNQKQSQHINNINVPVFLKTPQSVLPGVMLERNLNAKLIEGLNHFNALKKCVSLQQFYNYTCSINADRNQHNIELEFACFTNPHQNISVALETYFKNFYKTNILPNGFMEQPLFAISKLAESVENLKSTKPPYYEVILLEYMSLFFEMEYYFQSNNNDTLKCSNAIFSYIFQSYPSENIREDFYKMQKDSKTDIMKRVSFTMQNIKNDNNGIMQVLEFFLILQFSMILFTPQNDKIKRVKTFLMINYKHLKKNNMLSNEIAEAFSNILNDLDKIKNIDC